MRGWTGPDEEVMFVPFSSNLPHSKRKLSPCVGFVRSVRFCTCFFTHFYVCGRMYVYEWGMVRLDSSVCVPLCLHVTVQFLLCGDLSGAGFVSSLNTFWVQKYVCGFLGPSTFFLLFICYIKHWCSEKFARLLFELKNKFFRNPFIFLRCIGEKNVQFAIIHSPTCWILRSCCYWLFHWSVSQRPGLKQTPQQLSN